MQKSCTVSEVSSMVEQGQRVQMIDVRSPQEFAEGHIPGAVNIPLDEIEARIADVNIHDTVVVVCQAGTRAQMACDLLESRLQSSRKLEGGTDAWRASGRSLVAMTKSRLPLMRQVQLVVGPLILLGVTFAILIDPLWALLAGVVGAGLTLAGATGWCGMALLLAKLPWNRIPQTPKETDSFRATCC